ncbi:MAG: hypothetical protein C4549_07050 [Deltaproteobacteria bacterium]|jgi:AAA15 family ATPase/GTPase|nr:MAG: hypothetical protein C4549_07050 [Deltaproteobacteria bacterium]
MKILSLKVQNFKTFGPEGIFLSMTDLCALIGENNTGKSNILEALDLFLILARPKCQRHVSIMMTYRRTLSLKLVFAVYQKMKRKSLAFILMKKTET